MITKYNNFIKESKNLDRKNLDIHGITKYEWNGDELNVFQDVILDSVYEENGTSLPFKFGTVDGDFYCSNRTLTSLVGCPHTITGYFYCNSNHLVSLEDGPKIVGKGYDCHENLLTSLKGCPEFIDSFFECYNNQLTSTEYFPKEIKGGVSLGSNYIPNIIENYPVSIMHRSFSSDLKLVVNKKEKITEKIKKLILENMDIFRPLLGNKIAFHQMIMRLSPDLIQYYTKILPPSKKTMLFNI